MHINSTIFKILLIVILLTAASSQGQNLPSFELLDHNSIGLTPTPYEKWGQAMADIDNNGWVDIFCQRWGGPFHSRLYLNFDGMYQDITDQTPLEAIEANATHTRTVSLVDYDNDGDKDIFFGTDEKIYFLRNDNNVFTDVAEEVGLVGQKPPGFINRWDYNIGAWTDIDLDGDLDVIISQSFYANLYVFRNDDGIFTDVATEYGFIDFAPMGTYGDRGSITARMHWIDVDMDGDLDMNAGNLIFRNDNGVFTEVAESLGFTPSVPIQNSEWFDYDNDGDLDFFKMCDQLESPDCAVELWENQNGIFVDASEAINMMDMLDISRSLSTGDFDNDGDLDIFVNHAQFDFQDALLLNEEIEPGVHIFENVIEYVGISEIGDRKGGGFIDYDKDGFLDVYIPAAHDNHRMYHNLGNGYNWIGFILEGTQSNRDAIGSVVKLYVGENIQLRYTECPGGWLRQNNPWIHFGLGELSEIDSVVVRWPLGLTETLTDVTINQYHNIKEGETTSNVYQKKTGTPVKYYLEQNYPNPFNPQTKIRYTIPEASKIQIVIFDLLGNIINIFNTDHSSGGYFHFEWDGRNNYGEKVTSGVYLYQFQTKNYSDTKKMLLVR
jgi:enediyne biosynthesis protein E4